MSQKIRKKRSIRYSLNLARGPASAPSPIKIHSLARPVGRSVACPPVLSVCLSVSRVGEAWGVILCLSMKDRQTDRKKGRETKRQTTRETGSQLGGDRRNHLRLIVDRDDPFYQQQRLPRAKSFCSRRHSSPAASFV